MNKWVILGIVGIGAAIAMAMGGGGSIETEGGDPGSGDEVEILAGGKMTSGTNVAKFRVLRQTGGDFTWVQYQLPGESWQDLKDKGEVSYFDLGSGPLGIASEGISRAMGLLKIMGFRDLEGDLLFGDAARSL